MTTPSKHIQIQIPMTETLINYRPVRKRDLGRPGRRRLKTEEDVKEEVRIYISKHTTLKEDKSYRDKTTFFVLFIF